MLRAAAALWAIIVVPTLPLAPTDPWSWPVDPPRAVVRPYLAPLTPYSSGHRGVDIRAAASTAFAPAAGVVHFAGVVVDRPVLSIRHPDGVISSYEPLESTLAAGDAVARGDPIGTVLPGHCAAVCLHVGVRVDGEYVSPMRYLGEIPRAVLLPTRWGSAQVDTDATVDRATVTIGRWRTITAQMTTAPIMGRRYGATATGTALRRRPRLPGPATRIARPR
jgi:hypothetical protein